MAGERELTPRLKHVLNCSSLIPILTVWFRLVLIRQAWPRGNNGDVLFDSIPRSRGSSAETQATCIPQGPLSYGDVRDSAVVIFSGHGRSHL